MNRQKILDLRKSGHTFTHRRFNYDDLYYNDEYSTILKIKKKFIHSLHTIPSHLHLSIFREILLVV